MRERERALSEDPAVSRSQRLPAAYFRVSAIDHPVTDAPSILDFPTAREGEREIHIKSNAGVKAAKRGSDRLAHKNASILHPESYCLSRKERKRKESIPTIASHVDGTRRRSAATHTQSVVSLPRSTGSAHHRERWFELIGHPMGTAGARNNCPQ